LFTEDGQFINARGASAFGDRYSGRREVRDYFGQLLANCPNLAYRPLEPHWISGNKAVMQWHRTATTQAGEVQDWIGCDLLTFEGRLVKRKDTYFKIRT
jgi:SnoaL-like domain